MNDIISAMYFAQSCHSCRGGIFAIKSVIKSQSLVILQRRFLLRRNDRLDVIIYVRKISFIEFLQQIP
jgi:hypothetical protein